MAKSAPAGGLPLNFPLENIPQVPEADVFGNAQHGFVNTSTYAETEAGARKGNRANGTEFPPQAADPTPVRYPPKEMTHA